MSHEYLSDKELQDLISDIELNDMVEVPAYIQEKVLSAIDAENKADKKVKNKKQKIIEYRLYILKVALSIAAATVIMFMVPNTSVINRDISYGGKYVFDTADGKKENVSDNIGVNDKCEIFNEKLCIALVQHREKIEMQIINKFKR